MCVTAIAMASHAFMKWDPESLLFPHLHLQARHDLKRRQELYPGHDLLSDYRGSIVQPLDLMDKFAQDKMYSTEFDDPAIFDVPESRSRRLLEHRLLQNYIERTSKTFAACHHEDVRIAWSCQVPKLALEHDNLLYQVLSISAMHLLKSTPNDVELINARQTYHCLALREHRRAVAELNIQMRMPFVVLPTNAMVTHDKRSRVGV